MKNPHTKRFALLALLFCLCLPAAAAPVKGLYAAEVDVADDGTEARNAGLVTALQAVLVKLTGRADILEQVAARRIATRAPSLVQQFRYRKEAERVPPETVAADPAAVPAERLLLSARFDKRAVDRMLRADQLPVWGAQRPQVLLWLGREQAGRRSLVAAETDPLGAAEVEQAARRRGMALQLPLMDLEDQSALSTADLWAGYAEGIAQASARYPHDAVLTGRLRSVGGGLWAGDWRLHEADEAPTHRAANLSWEQALAAGVEWAQDRLAERYAPFVGGAGPEQLRVRFLQVDDLRRYRRVMTILESQEAVVRSALLDMDAGRIDMTVWVRGGRNALSRGLMLGGELFEVQVEPELPVLPNASPLPPPGDRPTQPGEGAPPAEAPGTDLPEADLVFRMLHG